MDEIKVEVNAGVHTNVGMDFQKNCAIFLFLEKFEELKNRKYFILLEHHEDIIFGFVDEDNSLEKAESYQAKKSSGKWTLNGVLEIIKKIAATGQAILDDDHPKNSEFNQKNLFVTNNTIELKTKEGKAEFVSHINETNCDVNYPELVDQIKAKIIAGNKDITFTESEKKHFENLSFKFIDFGRTSKVQLEQLTGKFATIFGEQIVDHKAALQTFLVALRRIETTFNQGNRAKLSDSTKRVDSDEINGILDVLTTKKKAYELWRTKSDAICQELGISILDITTFQLHYENSFDLFKDLKESEHQKIHKFILENRSIFGEHFNDAPCIAAFLKAFNEKKTSTYQPVQLKAVLAAAYVEVKSTLV